MNQINDLIKYFKESFQSIPASLKVISALLISIYYFAVWQHPLTEESSKTDFVIAIIIEYFADMLILTILIAIVIILKYFYEKENIQEIIKNEFNKVTIANVAMAIIVFAVLALVGDEIFKLGRGIYTHVSSISESYQSFLKQEFVEEINNRDFNKAVIIGKRICNEFNDEKEELEPILLILKNRLKFHDFFTDRARARFINTINSNAITRGGYNNYVTAYTFFPSDSVGITLNGLRNQIDSAISIYAPELYRLAENNDTLACVNLYTQKYWLFFDDPINKHITEKYNEIAPDAQMVDFGKIKEITSTIKLPKFIEISKKQWMINEVDGLLNDWKIQVEYKVRE